MKVLLLGEFSGLHKYLKEGLLENGAEVTLAANGDGWKQINGADLPLFYAWKGWHKPVRKVYHRLIHPYQIAKQFQGFDVVQAINPHLYHDLIDADLVCRIADQNGLFSLCSAGDDATTVEAYKRNFLDYYVYDLEKKPLDVFDEKTASGRRHIKTDKRIIDRADIIVPSCYEYYKAYESCRNAYKGVIPFPINSRSIEYRENIVKDKVVFFHGVNRELAKGTPYIREALEMLRDRYPNDVEIVIDGHLPFDRYLDVMSRANVVIDQCMGYSYGINTCVSMAQGKVTCAGNRKEMQEKVGVLPPIVGIRPDPLQILEQLKWILENRHRITDIGQQSRRFVEEQHDHVKIAGRYIQAWKSTGKLSNVP